MTVPPQSYDELRRDAIRETIGFPLWRATSIECCRDVKILVGPPSFDARKNLSSLSREVFLLAQDVVSKAFDYAQAAPNHMSYRPY